MQASGGGHHCLAGLKVNHVHADGEQDSAVTGEQFTEAADHGDGIGYRSGGIPHAVHGRVCFPQGPHRLIAGHSQNSVAGTLMAESYEGTQPGQVQSLRYFAQCCDTALSGQCPDRGDGHGDFHLRLGVFVVAVARRQRHTPGLLPDETGLRLVDGGVEEDRWRNGRIKDLHPKGDGPGGQGIRPGEALRMGSSQPVQGSWDIHRVPVNQYARSRRPACGYRRWPSLRTVGKCRRGKCRPGFSQLGEVWGHGLQQLRFREQACRRRKRHGSAGVSFNSHHQKTVVPGWLWLVCRASLPGLQPRLPRIAVGLLRWGIRAVRAGAGRLKPTS